MRKGLYLLLVIALVVTSVPAFAQSAPSKTTQDMAIVTKIEASSGVVLPDDFVIQPAKEGLASANTELTKIADFVTQNQPTPIQYFDATIQEEAAKLLPEGTDLEKFEMNEFIPVVVENYSAEYGDITVSFSFATKYSEGQLLLAMLGVVTGTNSDGTPIVEWIPLAAQGVDGLVQITFTQEALSAMQGNECMLAILSEARD